MHAIHLKGRPCGSRAPTICDAPGCSSEIPRSRLMCRPHWFALPIHLRREIIASRAEGRIRDWSAACLAARNHLNPKSEA